MFDYVKKSFLTGVGLALKSKSEIEVLTKELAEKLKLNQEEARKLFEDVNIKYEETKEKLDSKIENQVARVLDKFDIPDRSDINQLNDRIDRLTEKISRLQK